jgi:hypothetical protein
MPMRSLGDPRPAASGSTISERARTPRGCDRADQKSIVPDRDPSRKNQSIPQRNGQSSPVATEFTSTLFVRLAGSNHQATAQHGIT